MHTRSDGGLVHGCDEVNTRVKEGTRDKAGYMGWSYRYGTLTTPKSSPSDDRVIQTQGKTHTVETNERQASQRITTMICLFEHLYISLHSLITLLDHTSFSFF